jgi:hypothetical protein
MKLVIPSKDDNHSQARDGYQASLDPGRGTTGSSPNNRTDDRVRAWWLIDGFIICPVEATITAARHPAPCAICWGLIDLNAGVRY